MNLTRVTKLIKGRLSELVHLNLLHYSYILSYQRQKLRELYLQQAELVSCLPVVLVTWPVELLAAPLRTVVGQFMAPSRFMHGNMATHWLIASFQSWASRARQPPLLTNPLVADPRPPWVFLIGISPIKESAKAST